MLIIDDLSFSFGACQVLRRLSVRLEPGEISTLIGVSGSGKTTLFKLLTGILYPQQGSLSIAGKTVPDAYYHVAYMMQDDLLLPWRTVLNNLLLVGELGKRSRSMAQVKEEAHFYLNEVGLKGWEDAYPDQLSGGMRQRVSLARALLQKRPMLLLDEPFAALDVGLREHMYGLLRSVQRHYGTTILMVTHDFRDALSLSDRIFLLAQGQIEQEWKVDGGIGRNPSKFHHLHGQMLNAVKFHS